MTIDPKDITVEWGENRRITKDGLMRWDEESQQWVFVDEDGGIPPGGGGEPSAG